MGRPFLSSQTLPVSLLSLVFHILSCITIIQAYEVVEPNTSSCSPGYGNPLIRWPCEVALSEMPTGSDLKTFSTKTKSRNDVWIHLPQRYVDEDAQPACAITIDLEGHSQRDVSFSVSYDTIRIIAQNVMNHCIGGHGWGGWETYGLLNTFQALRRPEAYDSAQQAAVFENPDGSISSLGLPEGTGGINGFNVPVYMLITVSGPSVFRRKERTDYMIGLSLTRYLRDQVMSAASMSYRDEVFRTLGAFNNDWRNGLLNYNHPRWWQYTLGPPTPHPQNVKLTCADKLGSPSSANCEAALFQFLRSGDVTLGPNHPFIRTAGNCAIGVEANTKTTTSWDVLRSVAEQLLATCISSPHPLSGGGRGGFARTAPVVGRRRGKRQQSESGFPIGFTLSVYLQAPYNGRLSETCAWDVATSHVGDVRQCPAMTAPWRPPERRLGDGEFEIQKKGNLTEVRKGNVTFITEGNFTTTVEDEGLMKILSEYPLFASSTAADAGGGRETATATPGSR